MPHTTLRLERDGAVARIVLDRPDAANSIDLAFAQDLLGAVLDCSADPAVRAVTVRGNGRMFCAGGDLKGFHAVVEKGDDLGRYLNDVTLHLHAAIATLARMDAPVIAAVHGSAAGAGFSLACSCDVVLAAESARFVLGYTKVGLTPDGSATYYLPRLVGLRRALDLALLNRPLSAAEALDWGLITEVVPDDQLLGRADALAAELADGPTGAFGATKRLLRAAWTETLDSQLAAETEALVARGRSTDGPEGVAAFVAKRSPRFQGD